MAGNLKPPSYFSRPITTKEQQGDKGPELIPPSLFQKSKQKAAENVCPNTPPVSRETKDASVSVNQHSIQDEEVKGQTETTSDPRMTIPQLSHLKELSEATKAIIELNKENVKLRSKVAEDEGAHKLQKERYRPSSELRPPIFLEPRPDPYHHTNVFPMQHTSEIITKQATEIGQLKAEIQTLTGQYQQQIQELKTCVQDNERENITVARQREARLKQNDEGHVKEIEHLRTMSIQKQNQLEETIKTQSIELEKSHATLKHMCHQKSDLEKLLESTEAQYKKQLRESENQSAELKEQVKRLQTYMNDSFTSNKTTATWQIEKQRYNQQIKSLEKECLCLKTSLELTNLRLTSATEIQAIQDVELSKESDEACTKMENILTKWRENVFKLMVQRKSQDLVMKRNDHNHKIMVDDMQAKLHSSNNELEILKHKISDSQAELQIQLNKNKDLEEELISSQEVAVVLDQRLEESVRANQHILSLVDSHVCNGNTVEDSMQSAFNKLSNYDHRISYAVSRIEMLKGLFQRKDAMWRLKVDGKDSASIAILDDMTEIPTNCELALKEELKQTMEERDLLVSRLKEDAQTALQQIQDFKLTKEEELKAKKEEIKTLQDLLEVKSKNIDKSNEKFLELEIRFQETSKEIADQKEELIKERRKNKKVSDERQQALDTEYSNQLATMEGHLNTARREHTKAVVSMRQCERKAVREKQRFEDQMKSQETFYKKEVEKLQKQVKHLQKDNNILKVTLRQEGLIESLTKEKHHRGKGDFIEPSESAYEEPQQDTGQHVTDASLSNLVDDVKYLTSDVLTCD
ncbi:coiled-coil alpha-helical rod protein 1-like [Antedon mediterranea]|uniref:coiled-coil alpha-helical rod protein 1-like n=1 Tax=Antedon mediterranea TaxID=105859 RepID=UPI003AF9E2D9